jgi:hypothetical protein
MAPNRPKLLRWGQKRRVWRFTRRVNNLRLRQIETWSAVADTYGGRVHVEWDATAPVTPFGQLPFFIEYLKQGGLFDGWVADCPLSLTSPNAPRKRDLLGTVLLSVLAGHRRYAHITALRSDPVNPPLLGMRKVLSEDAVRRNLGKIEEEPGLSWLQGHLDYSVAPLLDEPWVLDVDTTFKPLYGEQEGAELGYNPHKPGRPSHCYHTYMLSNLRLVLSVDVQPATSTMSSMPRTVCGRCSTGGTAAVGRGCCVVTWPGASSR